MAKRLSREEKIEKFVVNAINEMFRIAGHEVTYDDIKERKDNWFHEWTMTTAQYEEFEKYAIPLLKKIFKFNTNKAKATFGFFILQYGLRIKD